MVRNWPGDVSGNSENCEISDMLIIQPKIPDNRGGKSDGKEIFRLIEILDVPCEVILHCRKCCSIRIRHCKFPEFRTGIFFFFVEWKAPLVTRVLDSFEGF